MSVAVDPVTGRPLAEVREVRQKEFVAEMAGLNETKAAKVFEDFILLQLQERVEKVLQSDPGALVLINLLHIFGAKMNTAEYLAKQMYKKHTMRDQI